VTAADVVLDASVLVRAFAVEDEQAQRWTSAVEVGDVEGAVPDLVFPEVANTACTYIRAGRLTIDEAQEVLRSLIALGLESYATTELVEAALAVAVERDLTAYDACYVALAEAADAVLVTADRRLAAAVERAELIG
jgi:predicted nucleic acid-binding protein